MSTYELTIYDHGNLDEFGRLQLPSGRWTYPHSSYTVEQMAKLRAKIEGAYRGPWCPDCGKKGTKCRKRDTCRLRAILAGASCKYVALPRPSDEWMAARGYGSITDAYHAGGRWKRGGKPKLVHYLSDAQLKDAYQHYAYELEMGIAGIEIEVAA